MHGRRDKPMFPRVERRNETISLLVALFLGVVTIVMSYLGRGERLPTITEHGSGYLGSFFLLQLPANRKVEIDGVSAELLRGEQAASYEPEEVDEIEKKLPAGVIYFGAPPEMGLSDVEYVYLAISSGTRVTTTADLFPEARWRSAGFAKISNRVEAKLSSHDFQITAATPELQAIRQSTIALWSWSISPRTSGEGTLRAVVSALIDVDGKETPLVVRTYEKSIHVRIGMMKSVWMSVKDNAEIAVAIIAIFTALIGVLTWVVTRARGKQPNPPG